MACTFADGLANVDVGMDRVQLLLVCGVRELYNSRRRAWLRGALSSGHETAAGHDGHCIIARALPVRLCTRVRTRVCVHVCVRALSRLDRFQTGWFEVPGPTLSAPPAGGLRQPRWGAPARPLVGKGCVYTATAPDPPSLPALPANSPHKGAAYKTAAPKRGGSFWTPPPCGGRGGQGGGRGARSCGSAQKSASHAGQGFGVARGAAVLPPLASAGKGCG